MIQTIKPPIQLWKLFKTYIKPADPTSLGVYRCTGLPLMEAGGWRDGRAVFHVIDEHGTPLAGAKVFVFFSTGPDFVPYDETFQHMPPVIGNGRGQLLTTNGAGEVELIMNRDAVPNNGEPGPFSAIVVHPRYSSDLVMNFGMAADHRGPLIRFTLDYAGEQSVRERLDVLERKVEMLWAKSTI